MRLVDTGEVELDKPVSTYLRRWKIPKSHFDSNKVTIRNLLSHTSGLSLSGYDGWEAPMFLPNIVDSLNGKTVATDRHACVPPTPNFPKS